MATVSKHVDHYQSITNSILAALEQGVKPWARPWTTKGGAEMLDAGLPYNAASGRNYRGLNVPLLWAATAAGGYSRHAWVSFKQAQELGGSVRKGEKATHVYFFKFIEREDSATEQVTPRRSAFRSSAPSQFSTLNSAKACAFRNANSGSLQRAPERLVWLAR